MKLILLSNILEHVGFPDFIKDTVQNHPDAHFLVSGDLLNIFPEPGEDLTGSIFHELYGDIIHEGMDELIKTQFANLNHSMFISPLKEMFVPFGKTYKKAQEKAQIRYSNLFNSIAPLLKNGKFHFIPGNMDYPYLSQAAIGTNPQMMNKFCQLDVDYVEYDKIKIGGIGGIPNTCHPFKGIVEISPYEMTEAEYNRRIQHMWGVDILLTHISPEEHPPFYQFIKDSPLKVFVCRAPFNFKRQNDFRGALEHERVNNKLIIKVRPFDFPENHAYMLSMNNGLENDIKIEMLSWKKAG